MQKLTLLAMCFVFTLLTASAQLPEKAEDISPLLNGEMLPEAVLKSPDGSEYRFSELLKEKPSVVLFYRGGWCPFCNTHLAEIQGVQNEVVNLGYQIIAISPDSPENLQATDEKQNLTYRLFSDGNGQLTKAVGIAFKAPERNAGRLLEISGGLNDGFMPVPSVFVADTSGKIVFEYINPDYRTRLSGGLLLAVLKELKKEQK
ncbi:MAG: AhpC/TSA family protein [Mariniphaga sp.]|nr:AhpC/TSA family protein [Mariniphaga sp.]